MRAARHTNKFLPLGWIVAKNELFDFVERVVYARAAMLFDERLFELQYKIMIICSTRSASNDNFALKARAFCVATQA